LRLINRPTGTITVSGPKNKANSGNQLETIYVLRLLNVLLQDGRIVTEHGALLVLGGVNHTFTSSSISELDGSIGSHTDSTSPLSTRSSLTHGLLCDSGTTIINGRIIGAGTFTVQSSIDVNGIGMMLHLSMSLLFIVCLYIDWCQNSGYCTCCSQRWYSSISK
jgi:hypothetical protein